MIEKEFSVKESTPKSSHHPDSIPLYGVDTMLFVYHFEENSELATRAEGFLTEDRRLRDLPDLPVLRFEPTAARLEAQ